jgi:response regulator RpfG family c-di-GMP phosphodiesterase
MLTILCLDDFTCGLAEVAHILRENGCRVLAADDNSGAVQVAAENHLDAVLLNCHRERDNAGLVTALRMLQPHAATVMFSGYCGVPCRQLSLADACVQKGEMPEKLLPVLSSVVSQSRYGFCRSVAV